MYRILPILLVLLLALPVSAAEVPILMYHHFTETETGLPDRCAADVFRADLTALTAAGYTSVTFRDLADWVDGRGELPEKPVLLTTDDGYSSVLSVALPLLQTFGMTMSVAVIGSRLGAQDGIPHFTLDEAAGTGLELVSHTWDLHDPSGYGVLTPDDTTNPRFLPDAVRMQQIPEIAGDIFIYPYGQYSADSEALLAAMGYRITVTTRPGIAEIRRGDRDSLRLLPRTTAEALLQREKGTVDRCLSDYSSRIQSVSPAE